MLHCGYDGHSIGELEYYSIPDPFFHFLPESCVGPDCITFVFLSFSLSEFITSRRQGVLPFWA